MLMMLLIVYPPTQEPMGKPVGSCVLFARALLRYWTIRELGLDYTNIPEGFPFLFRYFVYCLVFCK